MDSLFNKFKVAFNGLLIALKDKSILLQLIIGIFVLLFGVLYKFTNVEWLWIINCIFIVILSEMFNTCIEYLCNIVDSKYNQKIKVVKDLSASCVLLASIYSIVIGCMILKGVLR